MVAMMPNDDEDPDDDDHDMGYEERIAALEEDAGLSEATLATLTSQLSDVDSRIASQRDLCQRRRTKLDELRGRRTTLLAAVDDNERLVSSVGGALRRCLEAYRRRMAAAIAEDRRGEGGGDGPVDDGGDDDEEEDTDGASTPAAYDSMEDDVSLPCSLAPSENVGEVVAAAATTTTTTTATGGDDADGDGARGASEVEILAGPGVEESGAGSEAGGPMIPDDNEEWDEEDDESDDDGGFDGLPIDEWTGPPYTEPMKPPPCAGDADATTAEEESPSHPRGRGVRVGREVEVRCWAGSLLVPPPPTSSSRDASLTRLIRRAVTVEGTEVEARLRLRRPPDRGGGGGSGSGSGSISIVDIRRGFARGSCLDPMAVCHRWHSAGRRRLLPWECVERGGGDGGDDDRGDGDGDPSPAAAVDDDDDGGGETVGTTSSGCSTTKKPSSSSPSSSLLSPWLRYGSITSSSGRRRADGDATTASPPSIDPNAMLCPYEMAGSCVDPTCPYQHVAVAVVSNVTPQTTTGTTRHRRHQQPPPVVVERFVPLPDLRRIPVPSSLQPNPPSSSPPAAEDDPSGDDAASASAAAVVPVGMEQTTKGKRKRKNSREERPEESAAAAATTTTTTTTRVPGEDEDGDGSSKRSRSSTSPDHPPPASVTSSHHEERDFVALPDASSSSSSSSSLSSLWGDGDDSTDDDGGGGKRSVDESSIGEGDDRDVTMPWWWRLDLAPAVGLGDTASLHRLPLPHLLETFGFNLTGRMMAGGSSGLGPGAGAGTGAADASHADEDARVVVGEAWRSVLLRPRPAHGGPSGGAEESFSSATRRFGCAALDCSRVCSSAGRIRLASTLLRTCERLIVSSSRLADGKRKEKGDGGVGGGGARTTPDTDTSVIQLVASCLRGARSSILPAVRGASVCEIFAAQTSLFLMSEWLRALSSDEKADDDEVVAPQSDDDHHDEQRRGRRRVMTEGWWSRLLARCARPFDDAAAGDVGVNHMMATGEVGEGATSWVRREFRASTAIRPTDDEEDDSSGLISSSPPSAGTADVERLLLFLRCASFGGRLANAASMRFSSSGGVGAGAGGGRSRDVESVREMLLEPLWVEMEAFSRGAEEGDATSPSTERGSQKLLTNEVRATCCLLIMGPVHFQVTSAIMLTTGIAPGAASSSSPSSSPPASSLGSAREYASLSLHDSSFHRAISRLISIGTSRPGIPRSTDRDGRPQINDNRQHAWNPYLRGLLLSPLLAVSAATAVELGLHSKAQLRLENALSLDGGGDDERRPGGGALRGRGRGLVGGMVYSELVWSQLILLRSYFSSSSSPKPQPQPQPQPPVQTPGGPISPERAGISAASAARPDVEDDDDDTDAQTVLLSRRVVAFGVHPSHLSMGGDSSLIRSAAFEHRPSHARISSAAAASSNDEGAACCRVHRMLFHSGKDDHRCGKRVPSAEPDRAVDGSEVRRDDPTATTSSSISTDSIPLSTADGGFPRSVLLLGNSLKEITARRCRLSTLPETLGLHLPLLQVLDVSSNDLSKLPNSMCDLVELRILRVRDNVLTSLPGDVGRLARLIELDVSGNVLEKFPTSICDCVSLEVIDASNNGLKLMPPELTLRLKSLHTLNLNGNPLVED